MIKQEECPDRELEMYLTPFQGSMTEEEEDASLLCALLVVVVGAAMWCAAVWGVYLLCKH